MGHVVILIASFISIQWLASRGEPIMLFSLCLHTCTTQFSLCFRSLVLSLSHQAIFSVSILFPCPFPSSSFLPPALSSFFPFSHSSLICSPVSCGCGSDHQYLRLALPSPLRTPPTPSLPFSSPSLPSISPSLPVVIASPPKCRLCTSSEH